MSARCQGAVRQAVLGACHSCFLGVVVISCPCSCLCDHLSNIQNYCAILGCFSFSSWIISWFQLISCEDIATYFPDIQLSFCP